MAELTQAELDLFRTRPHRSRLWLSIYEPTTILACRVNDATAAQGDITITYDGVTEGSYLNVKYDMMMYVGTSLGGSEKGRIRVRSATNFIIKVAENSHIRWENNDYLTVVNFFEINAKYPRIIKDPADDTKTIWYKDYDLVYVDQNTRNGALICMGPHYAGFKEDQVYYTASGTAHVNAGTNMSYWWFFEGGTPTGSNNLTPGYIDYNTPGHYTTRLSVSGSNGSYDVSYRHVSIYDRPEDGTDNPILLWSLQKLSGSRGAGGFSCNVQINQLVPEEQIRDGSLVVIFTDNWYGDTKQSIGGNAVNRHTILFVGYVADGTIRFNYRDESIEFDVLSPTGIMKLCDSFSVSLEDIDDPVARATAQPGQYPSPWMLMKGLNINKALYHYLRFHSSVMKCADFQFVGTDRLIQYSDFDRESLYSAIDTLMQGAIIGKTVSDLQGKIWAETDVYTEPPRNRNSFLLDNQDWIGEPTIEESLTDKVAFIEAGGIAYTGFTGSTSTPLLTSVPGETPGYRGTIERQQGLALSSQADLNTRAGNMFSFKNRKYPRLQFDMAGNYRVFDIAPQEYFQIYIPPEHNPRGLTINEDFFVDSIGWRYDPRTEILKPNITFTEIPANSVTGETTAIPPIPPTQGDSGGFEVPPFEFPPFDFPPVSIPDFGYIFIPALGGNDGGGTPRVWADDTLSIAGGTAPDGVNIESVTSSAGGMGIMPLGVTSITVYPLVRCSTGGGGTVTLAFFADTYDFEVDGVTTGDQNTSAASLVGGGINWLKDFSITLSVTPGGVVRCYTEMTVNASSLAVSIFGWVVVL